MAWRTSRSVTMPTRSSVGPQTNIAPIFFSLNMRMAVSTPSWGFMVMAEPPFFHIISDTSIDPLLAVRTGWKAPNRTRKPTQSTRIQWNGLCGVYQTSTGGRVDSLCLEQLTHGRPASNPAGVTIIRPTVSGGGKIHVSGTTYPDEARPNSPASLCLFIP